MSGELRREYQEVDGLVAAYLDEQARSVDSVRLLAGVRARVAMAEAHGWNLARDSGRGRRRWIQLSVGTAVAASLMLGFLWTLRPVPVRADVVRLVREAKAVLAEGVDLSYRMRIELTDGVAVQHPILAVMASSSPRLWTRGDRYWIELSRGTQTWAWGRDENRRVWVAPEKKLGLIFEPREIPEALALAQDFHSLNLNLLMNQLFTEFDILPSAKGDDGTAGLTRIRARIKPDREHLRIREITLEIEERTKLIRRVMVSRLLGDGVIANVLYTFEQVESQADDRYRLDGHIDADALLYGEHERRARRRQLMQFFGSFLVGES